MKPQVLKTYANWELTKQGELKYFKNGRANMHVQITYHVRRVYDSYEQELIDREERVATGCFWIKTKKDALEVWNELVKQGTLNGTPVKVGAK